MNFLDTKKIKAVISQPAFVMFVVSVLLLIFSMVSTHMIRPYNSDDVTWQVILEDWRPFSGDHVELGSSDNFVDKIPFFALMESLFPAGRKLLLLESTILAVAGFTLFYISAIYMLRRAKITPSYINLLPFAWLASFGYSFAELYLNPIWRGFEIGVSFATFMLAAMVLSREINPLKNTLSKALLVLAALVIGIMVYSDPYYLYFTIGFTTLFTFILFGLKKIARSQLLIILGTVGLSLVFAKLTSWLSMKAGIYMVTTYPSEFIDIYKLGNNFIVAVHALLITFGADFFGQKITTWLVLGELINASILAFIIYRVYKLKDSVLNYGKKSIKVADIWPAFFGIVGVFVFLIYTISTLADITTYRYFIILVYAWVLFLAFSISGPKRFNLLIGGLLVAGIVFNLSLSAQHRGGFLQPGAESNQRNSLNYALIDTAKSKGLTKGYSNYWQGVINTYLSRDTVDFLPSICDAGQTVKFHWLVDEKRFERPAKKSFYLIEPDIHAPPNCTRAELEAQFGKPQSTVTVHDKTFLIFDYDISTRMKDSR